MRREGEPRLVWDLPLRLFHWAVVICVAGSWTTAELGVEWFDWHKRFGYAMVVLVAFRLAWGFVGPEHARFANFVRGPRAVLGYLRGLASREPVQTVGHSPLGALAVLAMLALLAVQGLTGLFANDAIFNNGPLYGHVTGEMSDRLTRLHGANFNGLLALIGLHLAAVVLYAVWKRIDLVRPMITGRKRTDGLPAGEGLPSHRLWLAAALLAVASAVLWRVIETAPEASLSFF